MISNHPFYLRKYDFNQALPQAIEDLSFANDLWPIVYIISGGKSKRKAAYVGETTDALTRLKIHLGNKEKRKLTAICLIESDKFNKSATLDIESNLIGYISGDGQYELLNNNLGIANHSYYQKEAVYWNMFRSIWDRLRTEGIVKHTLEHIGNSDLFKYSPYKSLSSEQQDSLLMIIDHLVHKTSKSFIIEGGAGTGKTVLAVFLFKLLHSDLSDFNLLELRKEKDVELIEKVKTLKKKYPNPKMALVIPMTSFRITLKKVFANVKGLRASMVVGPTAITKNKYDIIIVDEAHRLRRRRNLTNYSSFDDGNKRLKLDKYKGTELDWIQMQSSHAIYFYDSFQSIKPSDVRVNDFKLLIKKSTTKRGKFTSQFRVRGGNGYVRFIHDLLDVNIAELKAYSNSKYDLKLFNSFSSMAELIREKDKKDGLCRLIAGYSWKWVSKEKPDLHDIEIDGLKLRWNRTNKDWINSKGSVEEVGCIHTTQGYDLNYAGVILGNDIGFDPVSQKIIIQKDNYFDKNGRNGINEPGELKEFILNIYKTILLRGIKGTYLYVCDPDLRNFMASFIDVKDDLDSANEPLPTPIPWENSVPLFDLEAAAGFFSDQQIVDATHPDWVIIPKEINPTKDMFACMVVGESMNKVIPNRSICLFRKYTGGSRNGKVVLVESSEIQDVEMGSGYTVKEYYSKKIQDDYGWEHESIMLKPASTDASYQEIILHKNELESFKVVGIFERVLGVDSGQI